MAGENTDDLDDDDALFAKFAVAKSEEMGWQGAEGLADPEPDDLADPEPIAPETPAPQPSPTPSEPGPDLDQLRADNERLSHQARSDAGRVAALQRQIAEMRAGHDPTPLASGETPPEGGAYYPPDDATPGELRAWKQYQEDYPEGARATEEYFRKMIAPLEDYIQQQQAIIARSAFDAQHPGWLETWNSAEFGEFFHALPDSVKNPVVSQTATIDEVGGLLDAYQKARGTPPASAGAGNGQPPRQAGKADSILRARRQRLESGESLPRTGIPVAASAPENEEAAFNYYANLKEKEMRRR